MSTIHITTKPGKNNVEDGTGGDMVNKTPLVARQNSLGAQETPARDKSSPRPKVSASDARGAAGKKCIVARQFLRSFQDTPDDDVLMKGYSLTPKQLKKVYRALIEKGLLTEYEYHCRERKSPALDEPTAHRGEDSTTINLVEGLSEETRRMFESLQCYRPGGGSPAGSSGSPSLKPGGGVGRLQRFTRQAGAPQAVVHEPCPRCFRPKDSTSPEACIHCGVVFSKILRRNDERIPIWQVDFGEK